LGVIGWLLTIYFFYITDWLQRPPFNVGIDLNIWPITLPIAAFTSITTGLTVWSWITYSNIGKGRYFEARTATLILGIFGIVLAWVIGGVFILLAYSKLGEVIGYSSIQSKTIHLSGRNCVSCGKTIRPNSKFCEHCGNKIEV